MRRKDTEEPENEVSANDFGSLQLVPIVSVCKLIYSACHACFSK